MLKSLAKAIDLKTKGKDSKYFSTKKKGELYELKEELRNPRTSKRKDAVKKVIAAMTVGKDVSSLFTEVVMCMETDNVALKKLVYLYLINYAESKPELLIMVINTFRKDAAHFSPLIRGLAIRTMGCIKLEEIVPYIVDPLSNCLKDEDPYVRKTAALTVAKLFNISPNACLDNDFLSKLVALVNDSNSNVVAAALASLSEIGSKLSVQKVFLLRTGSEVVSENRLIIDAKIVTKTLAALNESSEWSQVSILEFLMIYKELLVAEGLTAEQLGKQSTGILDRVLPRLQHINPSVVMAALRVILAYIELLTRPEDTEKKDSYISKLKPTILTLLSTTGKAQPELYFVVLKNVEVIFGKYPEIFEDSTKVFFCKHTEANYIKKVKLRLLVSLVSDSNLKSIVGELKEYATDFIDSDLNFAQDAVRALGSIALSIHENKNIENSNKQKFLDFTVKTIGDLIQSEIPVVIECCVVVVKDLCSKYKDQYAEAMILLCENLDELRTVPAQQSFIYLLGHFADAIENSFELLLGFLEDEESFLAESNLVQSVILSTSFVLAVKKNVASFVKNNNFNSVLAQAKNGQATIKEFIDALLTVCMDKAEDSDIRSRAFQFSKFLESPQTLKSYILKLTTATTSPLQLQSNQKEIKSLNSFGTLASILQSTTLSKVEYTKEDVVLLSSTNESPKAATPVQDDLLGIF